MMIKRKNIIDLQDLIKDLNERKFNIQTQYKFIVLKKKIEEESNIIGEQLSYLIEDYGEKDSNGILIISDGGVKIQNEKLSECQQKIEEINNMLIQLPDIYFSLDELECLNLTLNQLVLLEPFIKN